MNSKTKWMVVAGALGFSGVFAVGVGASLGVSGIITETTFGIILAVGVLGGILPGAVIGLVISTEPRHSDTIRRERYFIVDDADWSVPERVYEAEPHTQEKAEYRPLFQQHAQVKGVDTQADPQLTPVIQNYRNL